MSDDSDVISVRHSPRGFGEAEMRAYFSQFGQVLNVRVVRSKKTNMPKNIAYIRFQVPEVAKIAADAMDNYLMFGKLMRCSVVSKAFANHRMLFPPKRVKTTTVMHKERINKQKSGNSEKQSRRKKVALIKKTSEVLAAAGITFEPVIIGKGPAPRRQPEATAVIEKKQKKVGKRVVKPRPLIRKKLDSPSADSSTTGNKQKESRLKVQTITPSSKRVSGAKLKARFL